MILDLFSMFDLGMGESSWKLTAAPIFIRLYLVAGFYLCNYYLGGGNIQLFCGYVGGGALSVFKGAKIGKRGEMGGKELLGGLYCFLFRVNLMGLVPWVVRFSRQLVFTMSLGVPLWLICIIGGWSRGFIQRVGNLVGVGLPIGLGGVIGLVELGRLLIRPITLRARLLSNIVAGHILLALVLGGRLSFFFFLGWEWKVFFTF